MKTDTSVVSRFGLFQGILPMQRQEIASLTSLWLPSEFRT